MRVLPAISPGLSASIAEVATMSDSCSVRVEDVEEEDEEDEDEDEEVEVSLDSDSESEDVEDEGPTTEDKGWDEAVPEVQQRAATVVETAVGQGSGSVPEPKRVSALRQPTLTTWIDPEDDRAYINVPT
ncbi:hypothetical protein Tco_1180305 [Tanacetum coccineum]